MKKININPISFVITVVALVALIWLLVSTSHKMSHSVSSQSTDMPKTICYFLNKPAVSGIGNDMAYVRLTVGNSNTVTGKLGVQFAGKDSEVGMLNGALAAGTQPGQYIFNGTYISNSEGMNTTAQEHITVDTSNATLDYYGVSLSIPHVDCSQYPGLV